ncbi:endonuclease/exonuclease/phosphatase family protein [Coralliovum pocilloporae]|uniref:endonuclease/exonuclease/phosphatase family protein n=1 Tax=Coralliovum pocilloporae TaxID=3066369 RepID=UPI003306E05E
MPNVVVCIWNIQNYGSSSPKYNGLPGSASNAMRNAFITAFIQQNNIDVLLIQEVSSTPQAALTDLRNKLNHPLPAGSKDWKVSWCACAVAHSDTDTVTSEDDLIFMTGARTEGYAVVWRDNQAARFDMLQGLNQIASGTVPAGNSPLNISLFGRPTDNNTLGGGPEKFGATGGYLPANNFPYQADAHGVYGLMDHWPKLNYPPTSTYDVLGVQWHKSRRPAYVVLKLNDGHDTLCPVAAYHAPSNATRASWGAFMSGLAREVYATNGLAAGVPTAATTVPLTKFVFGGDFNHSVDQADWPGDYAYMNANHAQQFTGGAQTTQAPDHTAADTARRTTVQLMTGAAHDTPIISADPNDYLRHKIDLAFFPRTAPQVITAQRINLPTVLTGAGGAAYAGCLTATDAFMAHVAGAVAAPDTRFAAVTGPEKRHRKRNHGGGFVYQWSPIISGAWGGTFVNWATTRAQFGAGAVTDARRAAEYYHIFVSDHLPLVATIPV